MLQYFMMLMLQQFMKLCVSILMMTGSIIFASAFHDMLVSQHFMMKLCVLGSHDTACQHFMMHHDAVLQHFMKCCVSVFHDVYSICQHRIMILSLSSFMMLCYNSIHETLMIFHACLSAFHDSVFTFHDAVSIMYFHSHVMSAFHDICLSAFHEMLCQQFIAMKHSFMMSVPQHFMKY